MRLIIVVPLDSVTDFHIHRLLDNIFQCLVLLVGLDDLIALRNIDRNGVTRTLYSCLQFLTRKNLHFTELWSISKLFVLTR